MNICPKRFYFVWFSPTHNFLGIDPTHTVYSLPPSWTQRERSASTHTVQFDQTTRWWAKVCLRLCVAGQEGTLFHCQRSRTNRNWMLLGDLTKFHLSWCFAGIVLTHWSELQNFPFSWPVLSSYWNIRTSLVSCSVIFQFLFCLKMNWNTLLKWIFKIRILRIGWYWNQNSFFKPVWILVIYMLKSTTTFSCGK